MKVILLDNVRKVGQKGEVVNVTDGYGRNFLIQRGLAKMAVGGRMKEVENKKKTIEKQIGIEKEKNQKLFDEINQSQIKIKTQANEEGHLFAAIHKKDIAKKSGLPEDNILLKKDIKKLGTFDIGFELGENKGKFFLVIVK